MTTTRNIAMTGDVAWNVNFNGSANVTAAGTLATVNSNVGSFTNANITVNAKGLITAASNGSSSTPNTWIEWSGGSGASVISHGSTGTFNSGKYVGIGTLDPNRKLDVNGDARLRGAIYDSGTSAGSSGQVLTSNGTGAWSWSTPSGGADQFWTTTTNSTSHEIILKSSDGTTNVSALKLIEGTGISLATSTGTFSNSNLTINNEGDLLINNEGYIGVEAGSSTSAILRGHNSSGTTTGNGTTINAGDGLGISETTSTNGGQITYTNLQSQYAVLRINTANLITVDNMTTGTPYIIKFTVASSSGITATENTGSDDFITINATGLYEIDYGTSFLPKASTTVIFYITKNGTSMPELTKYSAVITDQGELITGHNIVSLTSGDVLKMAASTGISQTSCEFYSPYFTVKRIN